MSMYIFVFHEIDCIIFATFKMGQVNTWTVFKSSVSLACGILRAALKEKHPLFLIFTLEQSDKEIKIYALKQHTLSFLFSIYFTCYFPIPRYCEFLYPPG